MDNVDVARCLVHLTECERCRAHGDLKAAQLELRNAIECAPLALMPYLKLGRERFIGDLLEMEPGFRKRMRFWGMASGPPKGLEKSKTS